MKKIAFFVIFCNILGGTAAQNILTFNKTYNVIPGIACLGNRITVYPDGYITYGLTNDSTNRFARISVTKIDTLGNLLWNKSYGKFGYGYLFGNAPGGGGGVSVPWGGYTEAGGLVDTTNSWWSALYRFDNNGDTIWTKIYNDSTDEFGIDVKMTREKQYIMGSDWIRNGGVFLMNLKKTDSLGNTIWQKTYQNIPGYISEGLSLDTCRDDGYIIASFAGDVNINNFCGTGSIFIMKTDSAGTPQWTCRITDPVCLTEPCYTLSLKDGGYLVCGYYVDSVEPINHLEYGKLYLAKISSTGSIRWAKQYGEECQSAVLYSIQELSNGDIVACGCDSSNYIGCILKTDSSGNQKWLRYYEMQSPQAQDYLNDIQLLPGGGFVACGTTYGSTENIWVVKADSLGISTGITPLHETMAGEIRVYPNPSNGQFTFVIASETKQSPNTIEVYNVLGEKVYSLFNIQNSTFNIDLSNQPNGVYLYRVSTETGALVGEGKLVIQR